MQCSVFRNENEYVNTKSKAPYSVYNSSFKYYLCDLVLLYLVFTMISVFKNRKGQKGSLLTYLSIPFLLLYLISTVELDSFHGLFHSSEEASLHSVQQEANSCHNAIYHQKKNNVCHHTSHIAQLKKCPLCHVVFHSTHLSSVRFSPEPFVLAESFKVKSFVRFSSNFIVSLTSRGPPINS